MKISCVICEYNPFHNGHKYMLGELRRRGTTHIAAIMSGNFTQRGEAAIFDKRIRARAALEGGADLVIELPVSFACAGAERFAYGGVYIAQALGCADELAFGSETGDIGIIEKAAAAVCSDEVNKLIPVFLSSGMTYAAAREKAVGQIFGSDISSVLHSPNDILGTEYIKALRHINSSMSPAAVKRIGAAHNSFEINGNIASASHIRSLIYGGDSDAAKFIPDFAADIYSGAEDRPPPGGRMKKLEDIIMYRLRTMTAQDIAALPEISEGLENRLYDAVHSSCTIEEIISATKSKRYTRSRIARIITYALLCFKKDRLFECPVYIRVLGMNSRGREILKCAGKKASLPIVMRYSDAAGDKTLKEMFDMESLCDDIYGLSGIYAAACGKNMTGRLVII